ncbi:hypothetical protein N0V83_005997 [Neocucurbitaria cava]|uniref:Uncharacterized protein n=1 Tax=Neocucurbitaria cava TaxID=798079 RepID=A0A9W8Y660_9PLEO|nr:hypothetical protein N0V83_005997 [Neocucurbitaria cava]
MSKNLMDTEIGGEQTQYEGAHTFVEPHNKQAGQLGGTQPPSSFLPLYIRCSYSSASFESVFTPIYKSLNLLRTDSSEGTSTTRNSSSTSGDEPNTQGVSKSDKIRYGQSIQEGGMGGKTASSTGEANAEGGFGGTQALDESDDSFAKERREQGYGGGKDMDRNVGA